MENVILTIHLILALLLIGTVLLQRSEGGGLGIGGSGGAKTGRTKATALTKVTWILAVGFIITSISLTLISVKKSAGSSVVEQFGGTLPEPKALPLDPLSGDLLTPPVATDSPVAPPRADATSQDATQPAGN